MRHPIGPVLRGARALQVPLLLALAVGSPRAAALDPDAATRLDPRLAALVGAETPVSVWVTFHDKGERDPQELAFMLAQAEADLSPANRARRLRAGLHPLVAYDDLPVHAPYLEALRGLGLSCYGVSRWGNEAAVRVPGTRLVQVASLPGVAMVRPVERARPRALPEPGPGFVAPAVRPRPDRGLSAQAAQALQYGFSWSQLHQINIPAVHDSGFIGTGVTLCMLDTGFNYHHKHDATRNADVPPGYERDFIRGLWTVQDTVSNPASFRHGMWTFSCISGNLPGTYIGAAPGATFALARTEYDPTETPIELTYWRMGAEWADSLGADIISSSLGYDRMDNPADDLTYAMRDGHTTPVTRAAEIAASKGILVVTAAGNRGQELYPWNHVAAPADANGDSVIAAGAVDMLGNIAGFSSRGPTVDGRIKPDLVARGVGDSVASASGNPSLYIALDGTSFSTPTLAGLAACILGARPDWPATTVIQALYQTASRYAIPDTVYGRGLPDGLKALQWTPGTGGVQPSIRPPGYIRLALAGPNPVRAGDGPARVSVALGTEAPASADARVRLYDLHGRRVRTLWSGTLARDSVLVAWDGRDDAGRLLRPGVYLVAAEAAGRMSTLRLVSLR